jgi:hypothetical protein
MQNSGAVANCGVQLLALGLTNCSVRASDKVCHAQDAVL